MAKTVIWSNESLEDIEHIASYISRDSAHHAQRVVNELINQAELVASHPYMGRIVPELNSTNIRECFIYSYRLIYQVDGNQINILGVIHGHRLLGNIPDRFDA